MISRATRTERDACGIGFIADRRARPSRAVIDGALEALRRLEHRGAVAADGRTGDGAGLLLPVPAALLPGPWCGLAMLFVREPAAIDAVVAALAAEGISVLTRRAVPIEPAALGDAARASLPDIVQLVLVRPLGVDGEEAERRAYRARRIAERTDGVYIASLSFRTVTYKALCAAGQLAAFYPDLADPRLAAPFAIFHQRFSTNTSPSWERAQPFRLLCHNGEINSLEGNVAAMRARGLAPVLDERGSDSAMLDNAVELLVRNGRDVRHAAAMLVPPAWQGDPELESDVRAFHRYHAGLVEPWDGPAGIVFTDGRVVGAALDRNGLRPLRWVVTDDLVACTSEAGAVALAPGTSARRGRLGPGELLAVDAAGAGFEQDREVKRRLARRRPYARWLASGRRSRSLGEPVLPPRDDLRPRQLLAGYTREDLSLHLRPAAAGGHDPVLSMGDDTALPPLAGRARPLSSYFRQRFAQVTNPPIDHLRERRVMSLETLLGARGSLVAEGREAGPLIELESFFLFPSALPALQALALDATFGHEETLARACARLADAAEEATRDGRQLLLLTDDRVHEGRIPMPALLAVGAVQQRLVQTGLRSLVSLLVASDEPRETHHFACLLGYGADAICPRLALETVAALAEADRLGGDHPPPGEAQQRFRRACEEGVLKVLARLGIADLASYRGAQLFEVIGLAPELVETYFTRTPAFSGAVDLETLEHEARARFAASRSDGAQLESPGYVRFRKGGEPHSTNPDVVEALQRAAAHTLGKALDGERWELYERFASLVNERAPAELRDLLELVPAGPAVPLEEVEPVEAIVRRFSSGGMSHGSLSAEAHETVAIAFNRLGARSNSGEGGEDPARYGTERGSRIKQVASGRFGVTPSYLMSADELQIKIAQGSKPGEGGQLPAHKVTQEIARLRHTQPGVGLISPPPHHDIYSIEDLAQLVFDLRQVNPGAEVSVKLVAEAGIGAVAAGVAKALADVIHVAGADGGTGASPLSSIKNAGAPWELGLVETQLTLSAEGLRGRVRLRVDGGLKTGRDILVAALLGADEFSFGTAVLIAQGCLMVRSCHLDTCPVGIATQRPELRAKFAGTPEQVEAYLRLVAQEVRVLLAGLGLRSLEDAIGRSDLVRPRDGHALDAVALVGVPGSGYRGIGTPPAPGGELGRRLAADAEPALTETRLVELAYTITNSDRAVGARLGGLIAERFAGGPPPGRVRARFEGAAGQSFGAFLSAGARLALVGEANDAVGKGMAGGRIVVRPPSGDAGDPVLIGNAALYGATGGELFCSGRAGDRFAVRNSGAVAVVEGAGDHLCEYMTGGTVVVLGPVGRNVGAGMSGGDLYVYDPEGVLDRRLNDELVEPFACEADAVLHELVARHARSTGSLRAESLLARWAESAKAFVLVRPKRDVAELAEPVEEIAG